VACRLAVSLIVVIEPSPYQQGYGKVRFSSTGYGISVFRSSIDLALSPAHDAREGGAVLSILGRARRTCEGLSRREVLQAGGAGLLGLTLPKVLAAEEAGSGKGGRARS